MHYVTGRERERVNGLCSEWREAIQQGIQDVYSSRGRYGAEVEIEVEDLPRNRVAISLDINEGEESRIRHINIIGNTAFEEEELLELFELGTKPWYLLLSRRDRYSREQFQGDLDRLESYYLDSGYVEFNIDSTPIAITPDRKEVYITINITEGDHKPYTICLLCGMLYPCVYEAIQFYNEGWDYFGSGWNLVDQASIILSIINWIFQYFIGQRHI